MLAAAVHPAAAQTPQQTEPPSTGIPTPAFDGTGRIAYTRGFRGDLPGYYSLVVDGTGEQITILSCGKVAVDTMFRQQKHVELLGFRSGTAGICVNEIVDLDAPTAPIMLPPIPRAVPIPNEVIRFAPLLWFAREAVGYPESAQSFYEAARRAQQGAPFQLIENTNKATLGGATVPTYFQERTFGGQTRINYWWFYGYQHPCFQGQGAHNGDWENVQVILNRQQTAVAAVIYGQHGGHYTRIAGPRDAPCTPDGTGRCGGSHGFGRNGDHPIVYPGKIAHGSYHNSSGSYYGNTNESEGFSQCFYYGDFRNPVSSADMLYTWRNLISLDQNDESWIAADRLANFVWGPDGVSRHPTTEPPVANETACDGSPTYRFDHAGCYQSECLAGDDQASEDCLKECEHGYDNVGLTCNKGVWPWEWSVYGRLTGGHSYRYDYTIPTGDAGLTRRRAADDEWGLP